MSTLSRVKDMLRIWRIRLDPEAARTRRFGFIDRRTSQDLDTKNIEPELLLLHLFLASQKAFVDIGANAGEFVYVALRHISASHIYACEPQRMLASQLRALFPGIHVCTVALSNHEGVASLKIPRIAGSLYRARGTLEPIVEDREDGKEVEQVPTRTLDAIREDMSTPIGCIKIDVEGHEQSVLEGAEKTLRRDLPTVIIEIEQRHHTEPISTIFSLINSYGLTGFFLDPETHRFTDLSAFTVALHQDIRNFKTNRYINNFIFVPAGTPMPKEPFDLLHGTY